MGKLTKDGLNIFLTAGFPPGPPRIPLFGSLLFMPKVGLPRNVRFLFCNIQTKLKCSGARGSLLGGWLVHSKVWEIGMYPSAIEEGWRQKKRQRLPRGRICTILCLARYFAQEDFEDFEEYDEFILFFQIILMQIILFFKIVPGKTASSARNWKNSFPPPPPFSSVFILLLCLLL